MLFRADVGRAAHGGLHRVNGAPRAQARPGDPSRCARQGAAKNSGFFGASFVEAPALFKRNGKYTAVFGQCCCYCKSGSPVTVSSRGGHARALEPAPLNVHRQAYVADSPLGPYTSVGRRVCCLVLVLLPDA